MSKLNMMVCPHDTAKNPERWFRFSQYLNQHLDIQIHLNISLDFQEFQNNIDQADLVYANPADTLYLLQEKNYTPLARPSNLHDEAVFIANTEVVQPSLTSLEGQDVATVKSMLATKIGLHLLEKKGVTPGNLVDKASWLAVIRSVAEKEVDFGIVYKDTYEELADRTKAMVKLLESSALCLAFHSLVLSPQATAYQQQLQENIINMSENEKGKEVLGELQIEKWYPSKEEEIEQIKRFVAS